MHIIDNNVNLLYYEIRLYEYLERIFNMKIFAIADTHLSGMPPSKPMSIFGAKWTNHWTKISTDWQKQVTDNDYVLLAGDISWAMKLEEALPDLEAITALPGKKIMIRGNHDFCWQTISKMQKAINNKIIFIHNNYTQVNDLAICGSRGWLCPGDSLFKDNDLPIYNREISRIKTSLDSAKKAGINRIILMLHYPPTFDLNISTGFTDLIDTYRVEICLFGHLHNEAIIKAPVGIRNNTIYYLVSCDALDFKLKRIL